MLFKEPQESKSFKRTRYIIENIKILETFSLEKGADWLEATTRSAMFIGLEAYDLDLD